MSAAILNLDGDQSLEQGSPYTLQLNLDDGAGPPPNALDLTSWTNIKACLTQPHGGSFSVPWTVAIPSPTNGEAFFSLSAAQTAALPATIGSSEFLRLDIIGTNASGVTLHLITGQVRVKPLPSVLA